MSDPQIHPPDAFPGKRLREGATAPPARSQPPHHVRRRRRGPQHDLPLPETVRAEPADPGGRAGAVPRAPAQGGNSIARTSFGQFFMRFLDPF